MRLNILIRRINTPAPSPDLIGLRIDKKPSWYFNLLVLWIGLRWIIYWREIYVSHCTVPPGRASRHVRDVGDEWSRDQGAPYSGSGKFDVVVWKGGLPYDLYIPSGWIHLLFEICRGSDLLTDRIPSPPTTKSANACVPSEKFRLAPPSGRFSIDINSLRSWMIPAGTWLRRDLCSRVLLTRRDWYLAGKLGGPRLARRLPSNPLLSQYKIQNQSPSFYHAVVCVFIPLLNFINQMPIHLAPCAEKFQTTPGIISNIQTGADLSQFTSLFK